MEAAYYQQTLCHQTGQQVVHHDVFLLTSHSPCSCFSNHTTFSSLWLRGAKGTLNPGPPDLFLPLATCPGISILILFGSLLPCPFNRETFQTTSREIVTATHSGLKSSLASGCICLHSGPQNLWMWTYLEKWVLSRCNKVKDFWDEDIILDYLGGS